jgi:hypothetical protein
MSRRQADSTEPLRRREARAVLTATRFDSQGDFGRRAYLLRLRPWEDPRLVPFVSRLSRASPATSPGDRSRLLHVETRRPWAVQISGGTRQRGSSLPVSVAPSPSGWVTPRTARAPAVRSPPSPRATCLVANTEASQRGRLRPGYDLTASQTVDWWRSERSEPLRIFWFVSGALRRQRYGGGALSITLRPISGSVGAGGS